MDFLIRWIASLLPAPDLHRTADRRAAVDAALRDADAFLTGRLADCGWRDAEISRETWTLIRVAVHEANRLSQPVATTAHLVVAAIRLELSAVRHMTSDRITFRDLLIACREEAGRLIPEGLEISASADLSAELMSHLTTLGPADPDKLVTAILADPRCHAATMLRNYATRSGR